MPDKGRMQMVVAHVTNTLRAEHDASEDGTGRGTPIVAFHNRQDPDVSGEVTHPIGEQDNGMGVAFAQNQRQEVRTLEVAGALGAIRRGDAKNETLLQHSMTVRRLVPTECEALQGFPNDYTRIPWRGKPVENCPDGPRYKALGNSWAVNCARWIGRRIEMVEAHKTGAN